MMEIENVRDRAPFNQERTIGCASLGSAFASALDLAMSSPSGA
jgi:hypothetical protein